MAALMCVPMFIALGLGEDIAFNAFIITILSMALFSALILFFTRDIKNMKIKSKESCLFVTLTWVVGTAFGCLPLFLAGTFDTYIKCYFEIMSGFTTTGATALQTIEGNPDSILFWRGMTNWIGGMGIVVLFIAVLPFFGVRGNRLVNAETVGPKHDKLTPKIQHTAIILWSVYIGFSALETILLLFGGLPILDALSITFSTMGAAGFSIRNSSIAAYNSLYVEIITIIFMIIAGTNFALYFQIVKGEIKKVLQNTELKVYLSIIAVITLLMSVNLVMNGIYQSFATASRYSLFHVVSVITTTGLSTADYTLWTTFAQVLIVLLYFIGGSAGSAGGGVKVIRVVALAKLARNSIKKRLHPTAITRVQIGGETIDSDTLASIAGFTGAYIIIALLGVVVFSLSGQDFATCFSTSFQFIGNIGIGLGNIGPKGNFSIYSDGYLAFGSFLMLVGRLELFTVLSLFAPSFWKK